MAYAFVNSVLNQCGSTSAPSSPVDMTSADLIVIAQCHNLTDGGAPIDSKGNTYTLAVRNQVSSVWTSLWYCQAPSVSNNMTFTPAGGASGGFSSCAVAGYSGSVASPLLATNSNTSAATASINTGSVTSGQLVVFAIGDAWTGVITATPGTVRQVGDLIGGVSFAIGIGDIIGGAFGGLSSTWNTTGAAARAEALIASFNPAVLQSGTTFKRFGQRIRGGTTILPVQH